MTRYTYAEFSQRMMAHTLDLLLLLPVFYLLSWLVEGDRTLIVLVIGVYLLYFIGFESSNWNATPGKKYIGVEVKSLTEWQWPIQSMVRNLTKPVSLLLFFGGFFLIMLHPRKQALHDLMAQTVVSVAEK